MIAIFGSDLIREIGELSRPQRPTNQSPQLRHVITEGQAEADGNEQDSAKAGLQQKSFQALFQNRQKWNPKLPFAKTPQQRPEPANTCCIRTAKEPGLCHPGLGKRGAVTGYATSQPSCEFRSEEEFRSVAGCQEPPEALSFQAYPCYAHRRLDRKPRALLLDVPSAAPIFSIGVGHDEKGVNRLAD